MISSRHTNFGNTVRVSRIYTNCFVVWIRIRMSPIHPTPLSRAPDLVSLATAPRLVKRSAGMASRSEGTSSLAIQLLPRSLTVCLLKLIHWLFRWTVWVYQPARPRAGHLPALPVALPVALRTALQVALQALTRCGWAGMSLMSLLPLRAPSKTRLPPQHLFIF